MISIPASEELRALFARLYIPFKLRGCSPSTLRLFDQAFSRFAEFLGHEPTAEDLTDESVAGFLVWRRQLGRAPDTIEKERDRLCALWRFLCQRKRGDGTPYVADWPTIEPEKLPRRVPKAWLLEELAALIAACQARAGRVGNLRAGLWWTALVRTLYVTGERIGAMRGVRWHNVDLAAGWMLVRAETRKGGLVERMYRLDADAVAALRAIQGLPDELVFPWPFDLTLLYKHLTQLLTAAGLPTDRGSKFHRVRKTTASYYKRAGGDPTELLGHADRKTTECYLDPRIVGGPTAADLLPKVPPAEPPPARK